MQRALESGLELTEPGLGQTELWLDLALELGLDPAQELSGGENGSGDHALS